MNANTHPHDENPADGRSASNGELAQWISASDALPKSGDPITAEFYYMGKIESANGVASDDGKTVFFDFYSGTGHGEIIRWKYRIPPMKPIEERHPWTRIENGR